ncbi:hypothetical protein CRI70_27580, partial [Streptomyces sp. Ru87]
MPVRAPTRCASSSIRTAGSRRGTGCSRTAPPTPCGWWAPAEASCRHRYRPSSPRSSPAARASASVRTPRSRSQAA